MSDSDRQGKPPLHKPFAVSMLLLALIAFGALFRLDTIGFAGGGFAALLAIPFSLGALATQVGMVFRVAGCIVAPIALFALLFPFVYFGLAEGLVCIMMVMPIWLLAGLGGGLATYVMRRQLARDETRDVSTLNATVLLIAPVALFYAETHAPPAWETHDVSRSVTIDASPDEIWPLMVSIPDISENEGKPNFTQDWIGIARPRDARIVIRNGQSVRLAQWGNDIQFEEHIIRSDESRTLAWRFAFPDDSIQRHTDRHISPDGPILKIQSGRYELASHRSGQSKLTLTTRYFMRSRMAWYLEPWGDFLLGDIEENVLEIVRQRAESAARASRLRG